MGDATENRHDYPADSLTDARGQREQPGEPVVHVFTVAGRANDVIDHDPRFAVPDLKYVPELEYRDNAFRAGEVFQLKGHDHVILAEVSPGDFVRQAFVGAAAVEDRGRTEETHGGSIGVADPTLKK